METSHYQKTAAQPSGYGEPLTDRKIRLASLCPDPTEPCGFSLVLEAHDVDKCPPFCALSYTWDSPMIENIDHGSSQPVEYATVSCGGIRLKITRNGFDFLAYAHRHGLFSSTRSGISSPELPAAFKDLFRSGQLSEKEEGLDEFPGYFWMDAICINQEDVKERSAQVSLMGDIYRSSGVTLVWMGNDDPPAEACWVMQSFIPRFLSVWDAFPDPNSFLEVKDPFLRDPELAELLGEGIAARWQTDWKGFCTFIARVRWFSRGWVVQEAVLGSLSIPKNVVALCGSFSIPWYDLAMFLAILSWCDWRRSLSRALIEDRETMRLEPAFSTALQRINCSILVRGVVTFDLDTSWLMRADYGSVFGKVKMYCVMYTLVRYIRLHVFTDPRDTIYGCLGLVTTSNPGISCTIKADYTLSVPEVLTAASWQMLSNMPKLDLLSLRESEKNRVWHELPSWVPDLSAQSWPTPMYYAHQDLRPGDTDFDASGSESPCSQFACTGGRTLTLIGAPVSVVDEIGPTLERYRLETVELEWFLQLLISRQVGSSSSPYPADDEALCRTLVADALPEYVSELDYARTFQVWWATYLALRSRHIEREGAANSKTAPVEILVSQLKQNASWLPTTSHIIAMKEQLDSGTSCPTSPVDASIVRLWYPRVFICTDDGRFGLANPGAQVGDEVWILKGGRTPFLLRRGDDGNYQLVGEAFVHGIMFGEILTPEFEERFGAVSLS